MCRRDVFWHADAALGGDNNCACVNRVTGTQTLWECDASEYHVVTDRVQYRVLFDTCYDRNKDFFLSPQTFEYDQSNPYGGIATPFESIEIDIAPGASHVLLADPTNAFQLVLGPTCELRVYYVNGNSDRNVLIEFRGPGSCDRSCRKFFKLQNDDGNAILWVSGASSSQCTQGPVIWASGAHANLAKPPYLFLQSDGNLILAGSNIGVRYASNAYARGVLGQYTTPLMMSHFKRPQCAGCRVGSEMRPDGRHLSSAADCVCSRGSTCKALAELSFSDIQDLEDNAIIAQWGNFVQTNPSDAPQKVVARLEMPPYIQGFVSFARSSFRHLSGGPHSLNFATNGGFTAALLLNLGDMENWGRVLDFNSGGDYDSVQLFFKIGGELYFRVFNGNTVVCESGLRITHYFWMAIAVRYEAASNSVDWFRDSVYFDGGQCLGGTPQDRHVTQSFIGKSGFLESTVSEFLLGGLFVLDYYLHDQQMTEITESLRFGRMPCSSAAACLLCAAGKYKDTLGSESCQDCPAGKYNPSVGASICLSCPGKSDASNDISGISSPPGSVSLASCGCQPGHVGQNSGPCAICEAGKYKGGIGDNPLVCSSCMLPGASSPAGSTQVADCTCGAGHACHVVFELSTPALSNYTDSQTINSWGSLRAPSGREPRVYTTTSPYWGRRQRYVHFSSAYLVEGPKFLDLQSQGGFMIVVVFRFPGSHIGWERIFDAGSGAPWNNVILSRYGHTANLEFTIYNRDGIACHMIWDSVIRQDEFDHYEVIYDAVINQISFKHNGQLKDHRDGGQNNYCASKPVDRSVDSILLAKSHWSNDALSDIHIVGLTWASGSYDWDDTSAVLNSIVAGGTGCVCHACARGKYKADLGPQACSECSSSQTTDAMGSTQGSSCKSANDLDCFSTHYRTWHSLTGAIVCLRCPKGAFCWDEDSCAFNSTAWNSSLGPEHTCSNGMKITGSWQKNTSSGAYVLTACPSGFQTRSAATGTPLNLQECIPCGKGAECPNPPCPVCTTCAEGFFKASPGTEACSACPANTFQPVAGAESCLGCQARTTTRGLIAQSLKSACICEDQYYASYSGCELCPTGGICSDGTCAFRNGSHLTCPATPHSTVQRIVGTWVRNSSGHYELEQCPSNYTLVSQGVILKCMWNPSCEIETPACPACNISNLTCLQTTISNASNFSSPHRQHACPSCNVTNLTDPVTNCSSTNPPQNLTCPVPSQESCDVECQPGTYGDLQTGCQACPAGKYLETSGHRAATDCVACAAGKFSNVTGASAQDYCHNCTAGTYLADAGADSASDCSACPSGKYSPAPGATSNTSCKDCSAGKFLAIRGSDKESDCVLCVEGKYSSRPAATVCFHCNQGKYAPVVGASACTSCGLHADSPSGSVDVADCVCNSGFSGPDGGECSACAAGTYKENAGPSDCQLCEPGSYSTGAAALCTTCPFRTVSPRGSQAHTNCSCQAGFTGADGTDRCVECFRGFFKPIAGSSFCMQCSEGEYSNRTGMSSCFSCPSMQSSPAQSTSITGASKTLPPEY